MPGSSQGKEDESSDSEVASLTGPERAEAGRRDVAQLDGVERQEQSSSTDTTSNDSSYSTGPEGDPSTDDSDSSAGAASTSYSASSTSPSSYTISAASRPLTAEHAFDPRFSPKPPLRANPNPRPLPPRRPAPQQDQRQAATRDVFARLYPEIFSIDAAALKKLLAHPPELKAVAHQRSPVAWDPPPPLAPRRRHRPGRGARWLPSPPSPPSPPNGGACAAATTPPPPPPCKSSPRSVQSSRTRGEASPSAPSTISRPRGLSPSTLPSATERPAPLLPAHKTEPSRPGKEAVRNPFARRRLKPRSKHNPRASPRACLQLPGIPKQTKPKAAKSKSGPVCPRPLPRIVREEALRGRILRLRHERKALLRRVEQLEASARQPSNEVPADDLQKECDASAVSETKSSGEQSSDSLEAD
ncbi:hypothetical protein DIPPA_01600 [Diplonema papillatum]|nr:hypothetical protein DIPPA_01600 [Diplonema papillatum]